MGQQSPLARHMKKKADLDHLFVSPYEIQESMRSVFDLIARRAYEIFQNRGKVHGYDWEDWLQAESEVLQSVTFEVGDSGDAFVAVVAVDNYPPATLRISAEPRCVRICGLSDSQDKRSDASEEEAQHYERFLVVINLPTEIDTSDISAKIWEGVLEVRLPKALSHAEV